MNNEISAILNINSFKIIIMNKFKIESTDKEVTIINVSEKALKIISINFEPNISFFEVRNPIELHPGIERTIDIFLTKDASLIKVTIGYDDCDSNGIKSVKHEIQTINVLQNIYYSLSKD